ncbi:hypothetical protein [Campylobacter sp. CCS1377]|uniref:Bacteriophage head to tail connecting protein n=1 Tax=Campylobacter sp. CCS1377 TaxID=3158229 RepID=A0AAU7EA47_9BACT
MGLYEKPKTKVKRKIEGDELVAYLDELIIKAKNGFENYRSDFENLINAYLLKGDELAREKFNKTNRSNLYIPKLNAKAKYLITSLNDVYFNSERMADIENYINSDETIIKMWQDAIDFYTQKLNLFKTFQPLFLDAIILGTSVAKVTWHKDSPRIEKVNLDEIFFDPNASNDEDVNYIVNEIYLNYDEILNRMDKGFYEKKDLSEYFLDEKEKYKKVRLYDIYEKIDGVWVVCTLFEEELLRKDIELIDGQPFIWGSMLPQMKSFDDENYICAYGESVMGAALSLQSEINITRNLLIDAMRTHLMPKLTLPKSSGVSREDIETIGKPLYLNEPSAINILPQANINSSSANLTLLESELTEVTGVSPQNNGAQTANNETATEISIKAQEGGRRSADYIRQYNETFIEPLFDRFAMLVFKYASDEFFGGFQRIDIPSFRFKIQTGTGAMNKEVRRAGLQASMQVFSQLYQMYMSIGDTQSAYNIIKANENLVKELLPILGIKNANSLLSMQNENHTSLMQEQMTIQGF